ncbi:glutathione S-transferase family protein [Litorivivens sp.]|uniref:glutathione S-transferase family protein n=1 Tax=Litorivivens sp. TaxID=2020868 RepID=UPI003564B3DC
MLKLYGFAVSDYFNMVKHVLLEKGIEFEEVVIFPDQSAEYLAKSPMGKVPCIETEEGFLCETSAILEYLEAAYPEKPLLPKGRWAQAKTRELMKVSELYIELSARRLLPAMLAGAPVADDVKQEVRTVLEKGLRAVNALASFSPYALGEQQTLADIVLRYSLGVAKAAAGSVLHWDLLEGHSALKDWDERLAANPICQQLDADMQAQLDAFIKKVSGK